LRGDTRETVLGYNFEIELEERSDPKKGKGLIVHIGICLYRQFCGSKLTFGTASTRHSHVHKIRQLGGNVVPIKPVH
jgi:hypothetical protein